MDEGRHVLDVLFAHAGEAVTVQDRSGLIFANDQAARMVGLDSGREMVATPVGEIVATYEMIDRSGEPFPPEALPGRRVLQGEPVAEEVIGYRKRGTGQVSWSRVRASPIKNDAGEVVWALNFFLDVTDEVRRAEEERLLSLARETLGSSLEVDGTLSALTQLMVPDLARLVAVHLSDDAGYLNLVGVGTMDRAGSIQVHKPVSESRPLAPDRLQARVVASRAVIMQGELEDLVADLDSPVGTGIGATLGESPEMVSLPLGAGERVLGTVTVARASGEPRFGRNDLALLRSLTDRAAVAFSNALLFSYERKAAEVLQQGLMPARPPHMSGWRTAMRYVPQARISGVGGDFYDVLPLADRSYAVVVGDVEGKGIEAAATVAMVRHAIRATTSIDPDPGLVFRHVNERLAESSPRMCTVAYLTLQGSGDVATVRVALAGHPPPVFVSREGDIVVVGSQPSPPAGVVPHLEPAVEEHKMSPGDTLVLCTDGFVIGEAIPPDSLRALLEGAHEESTEEIVDRLMDRLREEHSAPRDDVILLALRRE